MTAPSHITVTAPPGVTAPIHPSDGHEPGGGQLRVTFDVVARVRYAGSQSIRRAIARGDLILCDMDGAPVASVALAACPEELPEGTKRGRLTTANLTGSGPPAVFGNLPPFDASNQGPHRSDPKKAG